MPTFNSFQNILPDPNNTIGNAGQVSGTAAAGFASVTLTSNQPTIRDKTNSGRLLARAKAAHNWKAKITYNPMTREEFEPIYTFLLYRRGPLDPFYISLPQYSEPKDSTFATWTKNGGSPLHLEADAAVAAGQTSALIEKTSGYSSVTNKTPLPGDMFTVDGSNSNHKKAYMVTRVETNADYLSGLVQPATSQARIYFTPGLSKAVSTGDDFIFLNPLIKVVMTGDVQEYSLNTNNLYTFSLNVEEVQ